MNQQTTCTSRDGAHYLAITFSLLVALCLTLLAPSVAQPSSVPESEVGKDQHLGWAERLDAIESLLLDGKSKPARKGSIQLADEMRDQFEGGEAADHLLGTASLYRALASAALGREREALWHWSVAQIMDPRIGLTDIGRFGEPALLLTDHPRDPQKGWRDEMPESWKDPLAVEGEPPSGDTVAPRKIKSGSPEFPARRKAMVGLPIAVNIGVTIDKHGYPTDPVLLNSPGEPTFVYSTLEAVSQWRYKPAKRNRKPVPFEYRITMDFSY